MKGQETKKNSTQKWLTEENVDASNEIRFGHYCKKINNKNLSNVDRLTAGLPSEISTIVLISIQNKKICQIFNKLWLLKILKYFF